MAFAESVTCGLAAHQLSQVKGTSDALKGSLVCYNGDVKEGVLKIPKSLIEKHTAESQQVTDMMAKKVKRLIQADIHAALTGLAIFFSLLFKNKLYKQRKVFRGNALEIKKKACDELYRFIISKVSAQI
jgi:nicotinamide-nucleotide amidase